jgi:hypothetical protein
LEDQLDQKVRELRDNNEELEEMRRNNEVSYSYFDWLVECRLDWLVGYPARIMRLRLIVYSPKGIKPNVPNTTFWGSG